MVNVWWYEKNLGSACINGSGCGGDKAWGGGVIKNIQQQTSWLIRKSLLVLRLELTYLGGTHPHCSLFLHPVCTWWHIGALCLSNLSAMCFQTYLFSQPSTLFAQPSMLSKKLAWLAKKTNPKSTTAYLSCFSTYISFLEQTLLGDDTVDGRNPAQPGMNEPCKTWDNPHIDCLAGVLPSTISPFMSRRTFQDNNQNGNLENKRIFKTTTQVGNYHPKKNWNLTPF